MSRAPSVRRAQAPLLLRPSARTIRWVSFTVIAATGALVVWSGGRDGRDPAKITLPIATTLLCVWLCFLFEDLAGETTAGSPTPLLFRRLLRAAIALPIAGVAWFSYTWIGRIDGPTAPMAASFAAEAIVALAAAAVAARVAGSDRSGLLASAVLLLTALVLPVSLGRPPSVDPAFPPVGDPATYWTAVGLAGCAVLLLAHVGIASRQP
jgi:hypothetical protein